VIVLDGEVVVDRRPEQVFDYLADVDHYPDITPAIESAEWLDRDRASGPLIRLFVRGPARRLQIDAEVVDLDRPHRLAIRSRSGPARVEASCDFDPLVRGRRTRLSFHAEVQPTGLLRFAEGAVSERVHAAMPDALGALRAHLEAALPASEGAGSRA
jgi:ribosome-associated toxin RatA of RatAB toxin-antitoxin module